MGAGGGEGWWGYDEADVVAYGGAEKEEDSCVDKGAVGAFASWWWRRGLFNGDKIAGRLLRWLLRRVLRSFVYILRTCWERRVGISGRGCIEASRRAWEVSGVRARDSGGKENL